MKYLRVRLTKELVKALFGSKWPKIEGSFNWDEVVYFKIRSDVELNEGGYLGERPYVEGYLQGFNWLDKPIGPEIAYDMWAMEE